MESNDINVFETLDEIKISFHFVQDLVMRYLYESENTKRREREYDVNIFGNFGFKLKRLNV